MPTPAYDTPIPADDTQVLAAEEPTPAAEMPIPTAEMPTAVADTPHDYDPEKPNHMIIWLDKSIGNPKEYIHLKKAFATNIDPRDETWVMLKDRDYDNLLATGDEVTIEFEGVKFLLQAFDDEDACLAAFEKHQNKRIFFITSGSMGKTAAPKIIERYRHVFTDPITDKPYASVYVFCHSIELHMAWGMEFYHYVLMFTFDSELLERMTRDIAEYFIERGKRILQENNSEGALQRLYWAKSLWHQYDKMQQQIATDDRRPVRLSERMQEINIMIEKVEKELPRKSSDDEPTKNDDDTDTNNGIYQNTDNADDVNTNNGVEENVNNVGNENPDSDEDNDDNRGHEASG